MDEIKDIYKDYLNPQELADEHKALASTICSNNYLLHEVIHVYLCAARGINTNREITDINLMEVGMNLAGYEEA